MKFKHKEERRSRTNDNNNEHKTKDQQTSIEYPVLRVKSIYFLLRLFKNNHDETTTAITTMPQNSASATT